MKEIELLKIIFKDSPDILEPLNEIDKEIERLNNIIKEAIIYLEQVGVWSDYGDEGTQSEEDLLKILKGE